MKRPDYAQLLALTARDPAAFGSSTKNSPLASVDVDEAVAAAAITRIPRVEGEIVLGPCWGYRCRRE